MPHLGNTAVAEPLRIHASTNSAGSNDEIWTLWVGSGTTTNSTTGSATGAVNMATNGEVWTAWLRTQSVTSHLGEVAVTITGNSTIAANQTTVVSQNTLVWGAWNRVYNSSTTIIQGAPGRALSDEERQALDVQRAADQARWAEQRKAVEAEEALARERAEKLLQQSLDEKQRTDLRANGFFELDVISKNGDRRRYRIHRKWSHSIHQVDPANGKRLKTLCIHPGMQVPIADSMLAQKLMLESGMEEELLRVANHS